ncbi:MAG: methyltransferase domain-containing protein [bacterium]
MRFPGKKMIPFWLGKRLRGAWQKYLSFRYSGSTYFCPFCGNSFRELLPGGFDFPVLKEKQIVGGGYRKNIVCPRCFSLDRDRLIYIFLKEKTNLFTAPLKVLHVAPEGCIRALLMSLPNLDYRSGVKYYEGYYYDRKVNLMDVTNMPFESESFDVILCNHVLEHIEDDEKAIREIHRVLKPGAWTILQVPISRTLQTTFHDPSVTTSQQREQVYGQFDHVRIYGQDYPDILRKHGFMVKVYNPFTEGQVNGLEKYALNPEEDLHIAYK